MSEHSIEELKRQRDSAFSKAQEATKAFNAARDRLQQALLAECGWMNEIVEVNGERAVVRDVEFMGERPWRLMISKFRKDGKPALSVSARYLDSRAKITKHGQYEPD